MFRRTFLLGALAALTFSNAAAQDQKAPAADQAKGKYQAIEVAPFTAQEGVQVPAEVLKSLEADTLSELRKTNKFKLVAAETSAAAPDPTVRVSGTVTKYKAGSRAKRYLVGFGAGKSKVVARVRFTDKASGQVLHEEDVDGDVVMGLFGGDSGGATREVGKAVAKAARKKFF